MEHLSEKEIEIVNYMLDCGMDEETIFAVLMAADTSEYQDKILEYMYNVKELSRDGIMSELKRIYLELEEK